MSIQAQTIIDRCTALLDAEGTDHYKFDKDFKPAINNTQIWLVNLYNRLFGEKRVSEESLMELIVIRVFKVSKYSRLSFSKNATLISTTLDNAAAADNGDESVKFPSTGHGISKLALIEISGTTNYDGVYQVSAVSDADHFSVYVSFNAETFIGTETVVQKDKVWSVLSVYPSITTIPTVPTGLPADDQDESVLIAHVAMAIPLKQAKRITLEEFGALATNPLMDGSPLITQAALKTYAYVNMVDYSVNAYSVGYENIEIQISPDVSNELVAVALLSQPADITLATDYIPFPRALEELAVMKTLKFIGIKDDDRYDMYKIADEEVSKAVQLLS